MCAGTVQFTPEIPLARDKTIWSREESFCVNRALLIRRNHNLWMWHENAKENAHSADGLMVGRGMGNFEPPLETSRTLEGGTLSNK